MKKTIFALTGLVLLIASCSQSETSEKTAQNTTETVQSENRPVVVANQLLSMEISGMSCEMACGGSIREGLIETGAVARVQYDFEMGRDVNIAKISFDNTKISPEKMIQIVSKLNDKQFTVGETSLEEIDNPAEVNASSTEGSDEKPMTSVTLETSELDVPNLFDLLRSLLK